MGPRFKLGFLISLGLYGCQLLMSRDMTETVEAAPRIESSSQKFSGERKESGLRE